MKRARQIIGYAALGLLGAAAIIAVYWMFGEINSCAWKQTLEVGQPC